MADAPASTPVPADPESTNGSAAVPARDPRARRYEAFENVFFGVDLAVSAALLVLFFMTGASAAVARWAEELVGAGWGARTWSRVIYLALTTGAYMLGFLLPFEYLTGHLLDRRFDVTAQTTRGWVLDFVKKTLLSIVQMVIALGIVYACLDLAGRWWWAWAGGAWFALGVALTQLYPVLILPLFHRGEQIEGGALIDRLTAMAERVGARVVGVYRLRLSDKTRRANAAFAGLGATRRILLGDTLLDHFPEDEIEVVMAHEMGHYRHRDLWRLLAVQGVVVFVAFRVADVLVRAAIERWPAAGVRGITDVAGLPAMLLAVGACFVAALPLANAYSRRRESAADRFALRITGNGRAFVSAMRRLGRRNLADIDPPRAVEFFLHSHPSLRRRIEAGEAWVAAHDTGGGGGR